MSCGWLRKLAPLPQPILCSYMHLSESDWFIVLFAHLLQLVREVTLFLPALMEALPTYMY